VPEVASVGIVVGIVVVVILPLVSLMSIVEEEVLLS